MMKPTAAFLKSSRVQVPERSVLEQELAVKAARAEKEMMAAAAADGFKRFGSTNLEGLPGQAQVITPQVQSQMESEEWRFACLQQLVSGKNHHMSSSDEPACRNNC